MGYDWCTACLSASTKMPKEKVAIGPICGVDQLEKDSFSLVNVDVRAEKIYAE